VDKMGSFHSVESPVPCHRAHSSMLDRILLFFLILENEWPGANRNIAVGAIPKGVIVLQDADDLPHPQRLEIIRHCFKKFGCDHLVHTMCSSEELKIRYNLDKIKPYFFKDYDMEEIRKKIGRYPHSGNIAISKSTCVKHKWLANSYLGEDQEFNKKVYHDQTLKAIVIPCSLLQYRNFLSSVISLRTILMDSWIYF